MRYNNKLNLAASTFLILILLVCPIQVAHSKSRAPIEVKNFFVLNTAKKLSDNLEFIAWNKHTVYLLDKELNVIRTVIENDDLPIENVIQSSNSLFILTYILTRNTEGDTIGGIDIVIEYDIASGIEKARWSDPSYSIRSISLDKKNVIIITSKGEQYLLSANGFHYMTRHEYTSYGFSGHYLSTNNQTPIICTDSDSSKLNWSPSICIRKGAFNWETLGSWSSNSPPFICNNVLVQQNKKTKKHKYIKIRNKDTPANISIFDISTGNLLTKQNVLNVSPLSCSRSKIIYALNSKIIIRQLPTLEIVRTIKTKSKNIQSVILINNSVYWIDGKLTLHKMEIEKR